MSNPIHPASIEAVLIEVEAIRRAHRHVDDFIANGTTPAYRVKVLDLLANRYNALLDEHGLDGMQIAMQADSKKKHGH